MKTKFLKTIFMFFLVAFVYNANAADITFKGLIDSAKSALSNSNSEFDSDSAVFEAFNRGEYERTIPALRALAKRGNGRAFNALGLSFEQGLGQKIDLRKSFEHYQKAADLGEYRAYVNLAYVYYFGNDYIDQDYSNARRYAELASEFDDRFALNLLGDMHRFGYGIEQNIDEAIKFYTKAALQDDVLGNASLGIIYYNRSEFDKALTFFKAAVRNHELSEEEPEVASNSRVWLGDMYSFGQGVIPDFNKAESYYLRAIRDHQIPEAYLGLGSLFYEGFLVEKDLAKAADLFKEAAERGAVEGITMYGYVLEHGEGLEEDIPKAIELYEKAIALGSSQAKFWLGARLLTNSENPERSFQLLKEAGDEHWNIGVPYQLLSTAYFNGEGGYAKDYEAAFEYASKAAEEGLSEGHVQKAVAFYTGRGVDQNLESFVESLVDSLESWQNLTAMSPKTEPFFAIDEERWKSYRYSAPQKYWKFVERYIETRSDLSTETATEFIQFAKAELSELNASVTVAEESSRQRSYGSFNALLIGNERYQSLPLLASPANDVREIGQLLESSYGFKVETLFDASRKDIVKALNRLRDSLEPSDNLLIYYAGHGIEESSEGFWLPVDAEENDDYGWISNSYISRKLREIKANNILVVADSCFSGTITRDANQLGSEKKNYSIDEYDFFYRTKTRMALTAGGREPVLDSGIDGHSVFAGALISSLKNKKGPVSATEIFQGLRSKVIANSLKMGSPQTPILQSIPLSGHDDPDFVFLAQ